jgi:tRNA threonylcarbamoyladenosine biosynthesis protein TsaE
LKERFFTYHTVSDDETINLGRKLGAALREGDVVALVGELGSGKTWFTKGIGLGLDISSDTIITSPSFSLVNEYEGRHTFFHMDGYRLESLSDFLSAGLDEYLHQDGVVAMEWADRWPEILPEWNVKVEIVIVDERSRKITLWGNHPRAWEILEDVINKMV